MQYLNDLLLDEYNQLKRIKMKFILIAVVAFIASSNAILLQKNVGEDEDPVAAAAYHNGAGYKPIVVLPTCNLQNNVNCIIRWTDWVWLTLLMKSIKLTNLCIIFIGWASFWEYSLLTIDSGWVMFASPKHMAHSDFASKKILLWGLILEMLNRIIIIWAKYLRIIQK